MSKLLKAHYKISDNLSITEVRTADVLSIVTHINDPEIYDNTLTVPFPYTKSDGELFIDLCRKFEDMYNQICNYAIRYDGEMIGGIGFLFNYGVESHKSEFGYWLGPTYRNRGIMTKVLSHFVNLAFEEKQLSRLEANVFVENIASQRALEKAGFQKEGLIKSSFVKEDRLKDALLFAVTRE